MKVKYIGTIGEKDFFEYDGITIFIRDFIHTITDEKIEIKDPMYHHKYIFHIWKIPIRGQVKKFAIGEFSNNIYGIFEVE